jgi:hypothetical protein
MVLLHTGLDLNPIKHNLLESGASKGEVSLRFEQIFGGEATVSSQDSPPSEASMSAISGLLAGLSLLPPVPSILTSNVLT